MKWIKKLMKIKLGFTLPVYQEIDPDLITYMLYHRGRSLSVINQCDIECVVGFSGRIVLFDDNIVSFSKNNLFYVFTYPPENHFILYLAAFCQWYIHILILTATV